MPEDCIGGARMELIQKMAAEKGVNPSAIAIAWMTNVHRCEGYPQVIPLFSCRAAHLQDNLRGVEMVLSDEELALMNRT